MQNADLKVAVDVLNTARRACGAINSSSEDSDDEGGNDAKVKAKAKASQEHKNLKRKRKDKDNDHRVAGKSPACKPGIMEMEAALQNKRDVAFTENPEKKHQKQGNEKLKKTKDDDDDEPETETQARDCNSCVASRLLLSLSLSRATHGFMT